MVAGIRRRVGDGMTEAMSTRPLAAPVLGMPVSRRPSQLLAGSTPHGECDIESVSVVVVCDRDGSLSILEQEDRETRRRKKEGVLSATQAKPQEVCHAHVVQL